jgi:hypothetical protein
VERNERVSHIPRLAQPTQSAINGAIAVRMEATHRVTNRLRALNKLLIIHITLVKHIPKDSSSNRFQTVFRRRDSSVSDYAYAVIKETLFHFTDNWCLNYVSHVSSFISTNSSNHELSFLGNNALIISSKIS